MAAFQYEFQVTKIPTDLECQKTNQISASKHVWFSRNKIPKIAYYLYGFQTPIDFHCEVKFWTSRTRNFW
jgi:hypothetical protein